jgi:hypothetical protein
MKHPKLVKNAEKQKRYREKQNALGYKMIRGYLDPKAIMAYDELLEKTGWTHNDLLSNTLRLTYAAYRRGQVGMLNSWLEDNDR